MSTSPNPTAGRSAAYRAALCGSTLLMMAVSWPLWVGTPDMARVPFVSGVPGIEGPSATTLVAATGLALGAAAVGARWRASLLVAAGLIAVQCVQDQHRFQPWAYQFVVIAVALASASRATGLRLARLYLVGLYVHSGLSKLDRSFCREVGDAFLAAILGPFGVDPRGWPGVVHDLAVLTMPAVEIAVGIGLAFPFWRRMAVGGAVALHAALIAILGPWSLGHSGNVLLWNATLIVQVLILFTARPGSPVPEGSRERWAPLGWAVVVATLVLPLGERWGWYDTWPSHALYASHAERVEVWVHEDDLGSLPRAAAANAREGGRDGWRRLDLTAWSRAVRGTPVYPQARACLGLAEFLASRYGGAHPLHVVVLGRADRWTGWRPRVEATGIDAIRRLGGRSWLNAHPAVDGSPPTAR